MFCAFTFAFVTGCAKIPDALPNPPPSDEETVVKISAFAVSFDGQDIGFVSEAGSPESLEKLLCTLKAEELTSSGAEVKATELEKELIFSQVEVTEEEIRSENELAVEIYGKNPSFKITLIEREDKVLEFKTVYRNSSDHYEGTSVTKTEGKNGKSTLTYEAVYSGDTRLSRTLVEEKVINASQNKVVLVGTKKSTASSGIYGNPLKNMYVTSSYGGRTLNGKYDFHYGVDLRASVGTSVYASDGGKVIYAGTMGTYGKLVKIQHDNGDVTYYAHLNSISVKVGQRVYKGQVIAKSGATGNVTGPHLHFEIRINGKHKDPMKYL